MINLHCQDVPRIGLKELPCAVHNPTAIRTSQGRLLTCQTQGNEGGGQENNGEFAKIEAATQHLALTILSQKAPAQRPPFRRPPPPPPSPFLGVACAEAPMEAPHGSPSLSPVALDTSTLDLFDDILLTPTPRPLVTPDSFCQTLPAGNPQVASDVISHALGPGDQGQPTPIQAPRFSNLLLPPQKAQGGSLEPAALGCGWVDSWEAPYACDPQGVLDSWGAL